MGTSKQEESPDAAAARRAGTAQAPSGIHHASDGLGKLFGEDPARVAAVIQKKLPPAARRLLADTPWKPVPPEFIGKDYRRRMADLLYRTDMRDGRILYILGELKSTLDPEILIQLAGYLDAILRRHRRMYPDGPKAAVLLAVLYSGEEEWDAGCVAVAEEQIMALLKHGPMLVYILFFLVREDLDALCSGPDAPRTFAMLRALSWNASCTEADMRRIVAGTEPGSDLEWQVFLFLWKHKEVPEEHMEIWYHLRPHLRTKVMRTHAQMHEDIGRAEERKTLLQKMLETFFGPLPIEAQQRIDEATPEQLESWVKSLSAVLKPNGASIDDVLNGTGR